MHWEIQIDHHSTVQKSSKLDIMVNLDNHLDLTSLELELDGGS